MGRKVKSVRVKQKEIKPEALKLDIDYNELANAIVKAQQKVRTPEPTHSKMRSKLMQFFNGIMYIVLSLTCLYGIYYLWFVFPNNQLSNLGLKIFFTLLLGILGFVFFLCQQESLDESRKESGDHFNTNLSLIALIIALVALLLEKQ